MCLVAASVALAGTFSVTFVPLLSNPAVAAGNPGVPQPGTAVYDETFENVTGAPAVGIENYTGNAAAANETYTADPTYRSTAGTCNGWVMSSGTTRPASDPCTAPLTLGVTRWTLMGRLGQALGELAGETPAAAAGNHSLTEFSGAGTIPGVELRTSPNTIPAVTGHFYVVTADYAAVDYNGGGAGCDMADPLISLSLIDGTTVLPAGTGLDPCTAPGNHDILIAGNNYRVATLTSGALPWAGGSTMGVQQVNTQAGANGNDGATDNIKIVDVTPAMDKSFTPASIQVGGISKLTFTITNTAELDAKNGWMFRDNLPAGVKVADASAATTCPAGVVTAPFGATTVGVTGNLAQGMASCTVSVDVTSSTAGTYTNGPGNVGETGLTPPGNSTLTVTPLGPPVCSDQAYLSRYPTTAGPTVLENADLVGSTLTPIAGTSLPGAYNAIGYNQLNGDVYGLDSTTRQVVIIDPTAGTTSLRTPGPNAGGATLPVLGYDDGAVTTDGDFLYLNGNAGAPASLLQIVDVNPASPRYLDYVGSVTLSSPVPAGMNDFAFNPVDGLLYGVSGTGHLIRLNTATGQVTDLGQKIAGTGAYGAVYFDNTGNLDVVNDSGPTWQVDISASTPAAPEPGAQIPPAARLGSLPVSSGNDGAACLLAHVNLSVTKTASPNPFIPGGPLTYTVTVSNAGPANANGVHITDPLPAGLAGFTWTCTAAAAPTVCHDPAGTGNIDTTADIAAGDSVTFTITGTVPPDQTGAPNTATVTPPPGTVDPGCSPNCTATVSPPASPHVDLSVTKTATPNPFVPGQTLTYTVTVANAGPSNAAGVVVTDPLPAGLAGFTWTCTATAAPTACGAASGTGNINTTADIAAGGHVTYTITGTAPAGQTSAVNTATVLPPPGTVDPGCPPNCVATVNPPASPHVDLSVTKTAIPDPYAAGQALTYTVTVKNAGPSDATGVTVSDPLPAALAGAGFTWTCTASAGSSCTASGTGDITDTVNIAAGGTLTYTVTGTVPAGTTATLGNTATVTPPPGTVDPGCSPDCTASVTNPPAVNLSVTKTAAPNPYVPGDTLSYTVTVSNAGPGDATGVTVADPLPAALAGFTWTCAATAAPTRCADVSGSGDINTTTDIAAGGHVTYTVTGPVPPATTGTLANTATVTPPAGSVDPGCTPDCDATVNVPGAPRVDLSVTKTAAPNPYQPGETLTYTVTVSNGGPSDATGVTVSDPLPAALAGAGFSWTCTATAAPTACGAASGTGDLTDTADIAAGGHVTYTVTGTVPPATTGVLTNTATVTPPPGTTDPGCTPDCSASVGPLAGPHVDLSVTKTASPDTYVPGETLTYTVTVSNAGPADAAAVPVSDPLPPALAGFTWTCAPTAAPTSCGDASGTGDIDTTASIAAGGHVTYTITGTVPPGTTGTLANTATVTLPPILIDPGCTPDCAATVSPPAAPHVDLSVIKTAAPNPFVPGDTLTYTVTVANAGPSDATGVVIADPLPAGLAGDGFTWTCTATAAPTKCNDASGKGDIDTTADIAAGGHVTYTETGTVPEGTTGKLANTATVTPPPGTIDPGCSPHCSATVMPPAGPHTDLSVTKTASPVPYVPGEQLSYTIVVSNGGPSDAFGVSVSDPLPTALVGAGFTWTCTATAAPTRCEDPAGGGDVVTSADIAAGGRVTYTVTGTVPEDTTGNLVNTASVKPPPGAVDPGCDACTATVTDPRAGMLIPTDLGYWQPARPGLPAAVLLLIVAGGLGVTTTAAVAIVRRRRP